MSLLTDAQIAEQAVLQPIERIAEKMGLPLSALERYGAYKAKVNVEAALARPKRAGKLILVSAINPTPAGEGKTTVTIGLADALNRLGRQTVVAIREPSLGPVFGVKGGATGGGYAQVVPMADINLHFTGDLHAIGCANNLLAALIDNHIHHGNALNLHLKRIRWRRVVDMNDRQLRHIISGGGEVSDGTLRADGFDITVASEVMAIFCLSQSLEELKRRLGEIVIGYNTENAPVYARDLKAHGAMTALLKEAFKPNLVQTLAGSPAFVHGGPFANIAHGCNSVLATKLALHLGDFAVTEAGFGADLGVEKFCNIKCRAAEIAPDCAVVVATVRALKYNGGVDKSALAEENLSALQEGVANLGKHIENLRALGLPVVVALNRFAQDSAKEIEFIENYCRELGANFALTEVWAKGAEGGEALALAVLETMDRQESALDYTYELSQSIEEKIELVARNIYGAKTVVYADKARKAMAQLATLGFAQLPICMAKTPLSLSDDPTKLGCPKDFTLTVRDVSVSAGAGFLVVFTGDIMRMPGLPKHPAAEKIDVDADGKITGLF